MSHLLPSSTSTTSWSRLSIVHYFWTLFPNLPSRVLRLVCGVLIALWWIEGRGSPLGAHYRFYTANSILGHALQFVPVLLAHKISQNGTLCHLPNQLACVRITQSRPVRLICQSLWVHIHSRDMAYANWIVHCCCSRLRLRGIQISGKICNTILKSGLDFSKELTCNCSIFQTEHYTWLVMQCYYKKSSGTRIGWKLLHEMALNNWSLACSIE